jgi:hypothetical protein
MISKDKYRSRQKVYPNTRLGWYKHYSKQFDLTGCTQAAHLALWYFILDLEQQTNA